MKRIEVRRQNAVKQQGNVEQSRGSCMLPGKERLPMKAIVSISYLLDKKRFKSATPRATKSRSLRVATVRPWTRAVAAIMASSSKWSALPLIRHAHSRKPGASIGKTWMESAS